MAKPGGNALERNLTKKQFTDKLLLLFMHYLNRLGGQSACQMRAHTRGGIIVAPGTRVFSLRNV